MRVTNKYVFYYSKADFPSHHYPSLFEYKGLTFYTVEHFMMFQKAVLFQYPNVVEDAIIDNARGNKESILYKMLTDPNPQNAKWLGRSVKNYNDEVWNSVVGSVLFKGNSLKFEDESLRRMLMEYWDETYVEAAPHDCKYGVGLHENNNAILNPRNWRGKNLAGRIVTQVRDSIIPKYF